jgi:glycosyltransferase involved in cell wall biosynthesis
VESILGAHARLLRAAGHDVRVIAGQGGEDGATDLVPEVAAREPEVERIYHELGRGHVDQAAFCRLQARLADRLRPLLVDRDLVVAHNVLTMPFNLALASALVEAGPPVLAWTHDLAWVNPRYRQYRRPGHPYDMLHRPQPRTTYVAVSRLRQREIAETLGLGLARVPVVPNGVDAAGFLGLGPQTRDLMRRGGFGGGWPVVLVPVRVTRRKRIELAVDAARLLRPSYPDLRLVVSGPLGPHNVDNRAYAAELAALRTRLGLEQAVIFLHELAGPDGVHPVDGRTVAELYRLADCVVLPSESEGFGLPALEAGLGRVPMVAADIEVIREVAGPDLSYFPTGGGAPAVAAAIERSLRSRPSRLRRRVVTRHDWPAVLRQMEVLIERTS